MKATLTLWLALTLSLSLFPVGWSADDQKKPANDTKNLQALRELLAKVPLSEEEQKEFKESSRLMEVIATFGEKGVDVLNRMMLDDFEGSDVRRGAAYALGELGDKRAVPALLKVLVRVPIGPDEALGKIDDPRIVPELLRLYGSKDEEMAQAAFWALTNLKRPSFILQLLPLLKHKNPQLRLSRVQKVL